MLLDCVFYLCFRYQSSKRRNVAQRVGSFGSCPVPLQTGKISTTFFIVIVVWYRVAWTWCNLSTGPRMDVATASNTLSDTSAPTHVLLRDTVCGVHQGRPRSAESPCISIMEETNSPQRTLPTHTPSSPSHSGQHVCHFCSLCPVLIVQTFECYLSHLLLRSTWNLAWGNCQKYLIRSCMQDRAAFWSTH